MATTTIGREMAAAAHAQRGQAEYLLHAGDSAGYRYHLERAADLYHGAGLLGMERWCRRRIGE